MTSAQRARLVVAMGVLNLILATVALTAGAVVPSRPPTDVARASATPASAAPATPRSAEPGASATPATTPGASQPGVEPSTEPSAEPSAEPTASPTATEGPIVAVGPTPTPEPATNEGGGGPSRTPTPAKTPRPTHEPTPAPTAKPTAKPTPQPTPEPVDHATKPRPPCPGDSAGPPGHNKQLPPPNRPCGSRDDHGKGKNGIVFVLPLALGPFVVGIRRRITGRRRAGS